MVLEYKNATIDRADCT